MRPTIASSSCAPTPLKGFAESLNRGEPHRVCFVLHHAWDGRGSECPRKVCRPQSILYYVRGTLQRVNPNATRRHGPVTHSPWHSLFWVRLPIIIAFVRSILTVISVSLHAFYTDLRQYNTDNAAINQ